MGADRQHQPDIVFDQQHPHPAFAGDAGDQGGQIIGLDFRHSGGGFIQQQEIGAPDQRAGNRHAPLIGIGQARGGAVAQRAQPHPGQKRGRLTFGGGAAQAKAHAGDRQIVQHIQPAEQPPRLKGARHARPAQPMRRQPRNIAPAQRHPPGGRALEPGQHVHAGGLSRAIGPDQPHHLPRRDRQGHVGQGLEAAKGDPRLFQRQRHLRRPRSGFGPARLPPRPRPGPASAHRRPSHPIPPASPARSRWWW